MRIHKYFSDADLTAIQEAIDGAELRTSGEIVPYIVERIDDYAEARWRGATLGALALALAAGLGHVLGDYWGSGLLWITLPTLMGAGAGYLVAGIEPIGRSLVPSDTFDRQAQLRAEAAFLEEEVFRTRDRTGILIFLALYEHRAVILADEGIHRSVPAGEWDHVVTDLVSGIRARKASQALQEAIIRCGRILAEHKVERRPDDEDELADAPRIRES